MKYCIIVYKLYGSYSFCHFKNEKGGIIHVSVAKC